MRREPRARAKPLHEQEVKVERNVAVSNRLKKADYAFFAAPNFRDVKFYVEAKKPSRNLDNPDDYFQTIRYGWSSNTLLTLDYDFPAAVVSVSPRLFCAGFRIYI